METARQMRRIFSFCESLTSIFLTYLNHTQTKQCVKEVNCYCFTLLLLSFIIRHADICNLVLGSSWS